MWIGTLLLKCSGIEPGDEVIPLSMLAVRQSMSSLTRYDHVMDPTSLKKKLEKHPQCNFVPISHMRVQIADMDSIAAI